MNEIGVFDSGVGGLTILKALSERWPQENFIYLADTARLPYGTKSTDTIEQYLAQNIKFLLKEGVKAVVVACNTASTVLLKPKSDFSFGGKIPVPIFNVIEPGASLACQATTGARIGVMGTRATVASQAYVRAIHQLKPDAQVFQVACPLLVPLIEENWVDDPLSNMVVYRYLQGLIQDRVDTVVLGCTHYPILRSVVTKVMGPQVQLVDSASGLIATMESHNFHFSKGSGTIRIQCTDLTEHLEDLIYRLLSPRRPDSIQLVDL